MPLTKSHLQYAGKSGGDRGPPRLRWERVSKSRTDLRQHGLGKHLFNGGVLIAAGTGWVLVLRGVPPCL